MERNAVFWGATVAAACALAAVAALAISVGGGTGAQGWQMGPGMMWQRTPADVLKDVFTAVDAVLLGALFIIYVGVLRQMRSRLAAGMLIFTVAMLAQVLSSNPEVHHAMGYGASGLGPFAYLPDAFVTVALAVLVYLSLE